ncbi:MAG: DUF3656 domain-containing protein [Methanotrichaceae archaeon]
MKRLPELLAPAGSPDALKAAIAAGADAVYLGGIRFGARKFAQNFDELQLEKAIEYAHLHRVKVYVAVNTLIRDDELSDAARYLIKLYEMGADAVLVQDIGLAALARELVPDLDIHASTQMTIHNSQGAAWAAKLGMKRVVLAREVSLDEIKKMAHEARVGLEVFVHGALCYCYSGQCLLSSAIGGRSGNRGMCAQPCRKPYVLLRGDKDVYGRPANLFAADIKERFLLSTRDLSAYSNLDKIVRSPIESLKIEGRMKSPEYVAIVTDIYRKALDKIAEGTWSPSRQDISDLALAFNRDFTDGYLLESKDIMGRTMSDNRGLLVGSVVSYDSQHGEASMRLITSIVPEQGDGLVFISPGQELGMVVHKSILKDGQLKLKTPERVKPGAKVYLTSSNALSRRAKEIITGHGAQNPKTQNPKTQNPKTQNPKTQNPESQALTAQSPTAPTAQISMMQIPIDLNITWDDGVPVVRVDGPEGIGQIEFRADFRMEPAVKKPLTSEQIAAQLRRTGGTPFHISKLGMKYPGGLFAPLSALNKLRRDILAKVEAALLNAKRPPPEDVEAARKRLEGTNLAAVGLLSRRVPSLVVYVDSLDAVKAAAESGCKRVYFEPHLGRGYSNKEYAEGVLDLLKEAKRLCLDARLIWKWPRITKDSYLKIAVPMLSQSNVNGVMVEGVGAAIAVLSEVPEMAISGSMSLNVWNRLTVWQLSQFERLTLSPELSLKQLSELVAGARLRSIPDLELIVQGNLEVMVTEDCLPCLAKGVAQFWGLQDFKRIFPLRIDDESRTHIFNSVETCLIDYMPKIFEIGLDGIAIDARGRTAKFTKEMAELYTRAIELTEKGGEDLGSLKEEARQRSLGGITSGHLLKGLKEKLS